MNTVCRIGLDTAKNVFQAHTLDASGRKVATRRLRRTQVLAWFARLDRCDECLVGLEATGGSHYWARELQRLGYWVRMLNPQAVKPYRQGQKNDARDASAIAEAVAREVVSEAPIKSEGQQALLTRQGYRRRLVARRTALGNQLRGFLAEFRIVVPQGWSKLKECLAAAAEDGDNALPADVRAAPAQRRRGGAGAQARTHRLGDARARHTLPGAAGGMSGAGRARGAAHTTS